MADPHEPDPRVGDAIRRSLAGSGAALELEPIATDAVLGRAVQRRRRRRTALAGAALTAVVVVGGAVVATRGDDGTIQTTTDTTPPTTAAGANEDASADESSTDAAAVITTPPTLAPPEPTPAEVGTVAVLGDESVQQLFPWRDGFLAIGYERDPQVLPELPEDIAALFPDEVRALFEEEGLPPTIEEATAVLSEAGLLDEVTQVLADHPEASEAIYAVPADPPRVAAGFSTDGTGWTPVAIDPPHIDLQFGVFDDRLVGWGSPVTQSLEGPADGSTTLTVAASTDLVTWETTTVDLAPDATAVPYLRGGVYVQSLTVVGDRWLALVQRETWIDYESLLPDDLRASVEESPDGYGISELSAGIRVDYRDAGGEEIRLTLTWDDLGVDPAAVPNRRDPFDGSGTELWAGDFAGFSEQLPVVESTGEPYPAYAVGRAGDQFVLVGLTVRTSIDGRSWTSIAGLGDDFWAETIMALERGGSLLSGGGPDGQRAFVLGADGSTTEVALPELPSQYGLWTQNGSAAWVVELHDPQPWVPLRVGIEHDGMVLELTDAGQGWTWILRDATTGTVVAENDEPPSGDDIWVFDEATETLDLVITDPTTGDELLRVPPVVHEAAFEATYSSVEPADTAAYAPDLWLLATADGVEWHVEDLPDADLWPQSAAINGDRVLYRTVDGWQLTTIS